MILASSGPPGGPLGGLLGRVGPSWRLLGRTWRYLGPSWAVLEAVLDHLGRTWRPSWTILEAILDQRGHLGGHLEPSWRIFWELGDVLGVLWVLLGGWRVGPKPTGRVLVEKNQNQNRNSLARQAPL